MNLRYNSKEVNGSNVGTKIKLLKWIPTISGWQSITVLEAKVGGLRGGKSWREFRLIRGTPPLSCHRWSPRGYIGGQKSSPVKTTMGDNKVQWSRNLPNQQLNNIQLITKLLGKYFIPNSGTLWVSAAAVSIDGCIKVHGGRVNVSLHFNW